MTLWTCWSIPVTSIDPLHDPKISPENSEQASTLDELPGSHRNWFHKYLLQQRIRHAALAWSGCSLFSSLLIWFQPESLSTGLLLFLSFFFLVLCCAWTWFRINEEDALKNLESHIPELLKNLEPNSNWIGMIKLHFWMAAAGRLKIRKKCFKSISKKSISRNSWSQSEEFLQRLAGFLLQYSHYQFRRC